MANKQQNVNAMKDSNFDGGLLGLIGTNLLALLAFLASVAVGAIVLVVAFLFGDDLLGKLIKNANLLKIGTLALYVVGGVLALLGVLHGLAAMTTISLRWTMRHTEINGRRLKFDGKARQLMGNYIKWFLLTVITLTIYAWWLPIKQKKWEVKHTVFADGMPFAADNGYGTNVYVNYAQPQMQQPQTQQPQMQQMPNYPQAQYCPSMMYGFPPVYPPVNPYGNQNNQQNGNY